MPRVVGKGRSFQIEQRTKQSKMRNSSNRVWQKYSIFKGTSVDESEKKAGGLIRSPRLRVWVVLMRQGRALEYFRTMSYVH